ncbi:hypothetical protein [Beijerinckia indica]|uniref:Uncharacterized protein n=1 Tax=Beijerinckia indica subsp. indica (strain ATCC 9039 / DSM 1715 / NCIMB 8712) TaxID=395963 RepID=B2IKA5_BEII9|nr:hypothetical protein [Beijerinckia indica]ACB95037.1 hypothetical protein Bind_1397 [Beijerinckia indica subsp. indica ATCC 9039]
MVDPEIALIEALYARADAKAADERLEIDLLYAQADSCPTSETGSPPSNPQPCAILVFPRTHGTAPQRRANSERMIPKKTHQSGKTADRKTLPAMPLARPAASHPHL